MFTIDDVEKNFNLGQQTKRIYDAQNSLNPDSFYFIEGEYQGSRVTYEMSKIDQESLDFYYETAFANYWKRGVEKEMKQKGQQISPSRIQLEMAQSLPALNQLCGAILDSKGQGINLKQLLNNPNFANLPYTKMFVDTFSSSPYRFKSLFEAMTNNINSKKVLNSCSCKNDVITFDLKDKEQVSTKQSYWEISK